MVVCFVWVIALGLGLGCVACVLHWFCGLPFVFCLWVLFCYLLLDVVLVVVIRLICFFELLVAVTWWFAVGYFLFAGCWFVWLYCLNFVVLTGSCFAMVCVLFLFVFLFCVIMWLFVCVVGVCCLLRLMWFCYCLLAELVLIK